MHRRDHAMPDCQVVMTQLWTEVARDESSPDAAAVEAHIRQCAVCQSPEEFERSFLAGMRAAGRNHPDPLGLLFRIRLSPGVARGV